MIGHAADTLLNLVHAPRCPGMNRRVDVVELPFIRRDLPIGVHVPLAQHQDELLFGEVGVDKGERNAMKGKIPRRVPRVFPLVGHGDDVFVVEVAPVEIARMVAAARGKRIGGVARCPCSYVVVVELLAP